jgi:hypothetical protein
MSLTDGAEAVAPLLFSMALDASNRFQVREIPRRTLPLLRVLAWGSLALAVVVQADPHRGRDGALDFWAPLMSMEGFVVFLGLWGTYVVVLEGVVLKSWRVWLEEQRPDSAGLPCVPQAGTPLKRGSENDSSLWR